MNTTLFPYFQPIVGAASGLIMGYEALARRLNPEGKVISAGGLFCDPNLAHQDLIAWDRSVRYQALEKFRQLSSNVYLTLNISAAWIDYLDDVNLLPTLKMLDELGVDKNRVVIEITESQGDVDKLAEVVKIYRQQGLRIAIDDFGAGFSQLERVMAIRPDIIKLDMQLFQQATKGGIASDVVHLLSRLAKRTGCRVVCEGVETDDDFLFGLNCGAQYMQGYLFSPATEKFQNPENFYQKISSLRTHFLNRTLEREAEKMQFITRIKNLITYLKNQMQDEVEIETLPTELFEQSGVLRFYLCNNEGNQISPNFNFVEGKWIKDAEPIGFNWAWRPYFYQLLAIESSLNDSYRIVTSERYRDFSSAMLCKTLSLRLDAHRVLLVDITAEWS